MPAVAATSSAASHCQRSARDKSPSSQNTMPRNRVSPDSASSRLTTDPAPAATTMPVSRRVGVQPPGPCASANTSRHAASAPSAAMPSTPAAGSRHDCSSAATDAPLETPSTHGSASGLRSKTCGSAPASASSAHAQGLHRAEGVTPARRRERAKCGRATRVPCISERDRRAPERERQREYDDGHGWQGG